MEGPPFAALADPGEDGAELMIGRVLAIDLGAKRIGLALSDPTGTIATPFGVIEHISMRTDAASISQTARENDIVLIVVGVPMNENEHESPQIRHAYRFLKAIQMETHVPALLWDESFSTNVAQETRIAMGVSRKKRSGHLDDLAAAIILQSYLDAQSKQERI